MATYKQAYLKNLECYMNEYSKVFRIYKEALTTSGMYLPEYISELYNHATLDIKPVNERFNKALKDIINSAIDRIKNLITLNMADSAYQLKLNNTLKTLELTCDELENYEIEYLIEPFKDDEISMRVIKKIITKVKGEGMAFNYMYKESNKTKSLRLLEQLKINVDKLINTNSIEFDGKDMHYKGMKEFVERPLDDNMLYSEKVKEEWNNKMLLKQLQNEKAKVMYDPNTGRYLGNKTF